MKIGMVTETDEEYHGGEGVSKSRLWTLETKTPHHARYGAQKEKPHFAIGKAAHIAILEPERLEESVTRGPADRRGNKWKEAQDFSEHHGTILLTEKDHDMAMMIRDLAACVPEIEVMQRGEKHIETSAYHVDEETGLLVKTRPDIYSVGERLIADIKNMKDASYDGFKRDVGKFGYHMQDALYSDVWEKSTALKVDGFFFIAFEKSDPPVVACYELKASAVTEGYERYRAALKKYAECEKTGKWPGYPAGIQKMGLNRWDHKVTPAPEGDEPDEDQYMIDSDEDDDDDDTNDA